MRSRTTTLLPLQLALVLLSMSVAFPDPSMGGGSAPGPEAVAQARRILKATGVRGGLVVHLGCGDGQLTTALRASERYLVHGLDREAVNVAKAREHVRSLGLYGPVSVDTFGGKHLPYADSLVNLLVADELHGVPMAEVMRVLAPRGVAIIRGKKTVKPWPRDIDEWTHDLHDAGGNAVARDRVVGPPRHLQWTARPLWARSHGWTPSVSAMVSARGRLFAICDETLTCVDGTVPSRWFLTARDAFNGVLLWKRPVPNWDAADLSGTHGTGRGVTTGRFTMPPHLGKRLVAVGDTVYATLGAAAPVTALDAATGEVRRVYAETANADEFLCTEGRLIMSLNPTNQPKAKIPGRGETPDPVPGKRVCAVDARTGRVLWNRGPFTAIRATRGQDPFGRLELAAGDGKVFLLTSEAIECLAADSGETLWHIERPALPDNAVRRLGFAGVYEYLLTVMVTHDGVVLLAQPEPNTHHTYHTMPGTLYAFDAASGRQMWKHAYGGWGHCTPPDVFVVGDLVWTHVNAETEYGSVWGNGTRAKNPAAVDYRVQALGLRTGALRKELRTKDLFNVGHHHRCYRNRITERFLMSSRRGVEFVDLASGETQQHHWVRSGCLQGNLPCNGLLYVAPHPCGCYIEAKLTGFNALAPAAKTPASAPAVLDRLERGPAYGAIGNRKSPIANPQDWPTYRHDGRRSSATDTAIPTDLTLAWRTRIGARPSSVVVAEGKLFVADVDGHAVHAVDAADGKPAWSTIAGARVDSPPTVYEGLAIFGSADGWVHCLRASDGARVWRFQAAPMPRRVVAFGRVESPWPVPGSVLIHDGKCWFAAGRSSYLDGGITLYALDPATGRVERQEVLYSADPATGKMAPLTSGFSMPGLLNDIPSTDGASVFIRQMPVAASGGGGKPPRERGPRVFTTAGYLDPSWFNRTFWKSGRAQTSGLMVLGHDAAYGVEVYPSRSRESVFRPGARAYRLMCLSLKPLPRPAAKGTKQPRARQRGPKPVWEKRIGIRIIAMARAANTIFVAGSPDVVDPQDPHGAWEGRKGGVLAAFSAVDGQKLAEHKLPSPPVFDAMAIASHRLYLSTMDGHVLCMAGKP